MMTGRLFVLAIAAALPAQAQSGMTGQTGSLAQPPIATWHSMDRVGAAGTLTTLAGVPLGFMFGPAATTIPPNPHAPFSAVILDQAEQTLNDGTNISRESREIVARDSFGRVYRAREIHLRNAQSQEAERLVLFSITDPVRHVFYHCSPVPKICSQLEYRRPNLSHMRRFDPNKIPGATVEDLGSSDMSGLEVEGKRLTRVIAEGAVGNDRPFSATVETWHSKELDVDVQVKRADPRMGTRTNTMTEVSPGEPNPKYFQIPEGYRVEVRKGVTAGLAPLGSNAEPATRNPAEAQPPMR